MHLNLRLSSNRIIKPAIAVTLLLSSVGVGIALYRRSQPTAIQVSRPTVVDAIEAQNPKAQPLPLQTSPPLPGAATAPLVEVLRVNQPVINAYAGPSAQAEVVTQAIYGEPVEVLTESGDWREVAFPDQSHYTGWIPAANLQLNQVDESAPQQRWIVTTRLAKVHASSDSSTEVLTKLRLGSLLDGLETQDNWTQVRLEGGKLGYVLTEQIALHKREPTNGVSAEAIAHTAKQLLGQPYLWGGMTTDGVDCSGFIHTVFKTHGIQLHRDADQQFFNDGFPVNRQDLQTGDLVFFETYAPGPSHVGIFLGNNQFIQAGSSSGVTLTSMSDPYFSPRFLGARRIENLIQAGSLQDT